MANKYGPWATPLNTGINPQLSSFWRRRLKMLVSVSQASPLLSWRNLLGLCTAAVFLIVLPTLRSSAEAADENKWDHKLKEAVDTSLAADRRSMTNKFAEGIQPSKPSYNIQCRIIDANGASVMSPQATLYEGQEGFIEDRSQSPFVIGVSTEKDVKQPHIVVLKEGTLITLTVFGLDGMAESAQGKDKREITKVPVPVSEGATLDVTVEQSKIGNVDRKAVSATTTLQLPHLDTNKKRVIDFVKYGEILTIPMGEKSASGTVPRVELVCGPAGKIETPSDWKSSAVKPLPNLIDAYQPPTQREQEHGK